MQASWREIINHEKTLNDIDEFGIWDVYPFEEEGLVFIVANERGSAHGEVHSFWKRPARPLVAGPRFMEQVWERSGLNRLTALVPLGDKRIAAWLTRYGWRDTGERVPGAEVWEIFKHDS